jgi:hypothetical protein
MEPWGGQAMKSLIYKKPLLSAVSLNIITLIIFIYSINNGETVPFMFSVLAGVFNRRIIDNGENINIKKKTIITISFFLMIIITFSYIIYINNVKNHQLINSTFLNR